MKLFKPEGYNSVSPYFIVNGAQKFVDFLIQVFDATEKRRYDNDNGTIMHLELQIDDSIIMLADSSDQWPPSTHMMHVYVKIQKGVLIAPWNMVVKYWNDRQIKRATPTNAEPSKIPGVICGQFPPNSIEFRATSDGKLSRRTFYYQSNELK